MLLGDVLEYSSSWNKCPIREIGGDVGIGRAGGAGLCP